MNDHREQFGVERLTAVHAYADGAFQADDMMVVMIERKSSL